VAAQVGSLALTAIAARLDRSLGLLTRGPRDLPSRQRTLRATLDWSHDLLSLPEQLLLRRLAVFVGGWTLDAAEQICAGEGVETTDIVDLLGALVNKSLVVLEEAGGDPRYRLLEMVRQYGLQQLEQADERAVVQDRHLAWCVALAEQSAPALLGPDQGTWMDRLDRNLDNLRAALPWALDRRVTVLGLRLAGALGKFWLRAGHQREGQGWLAAVLSLPEEDNTAALAARARALDAAAWLANDRHDFAQAATLFAQSDTLRRAGGQDEDTDGSLINAAMEARAGEDYPRATALLEAYVAQQRALGSRVTGRQDDPERVVAIANRYTSLLALVLREQGGYARATVLCEECLARSQELDDVEGVAIALLNLADLARDQGDARRVRALCEEGFVTLKSHERAKGVPACALPRCLWTSVKQRHPSRPARARNACPGLRDGRSPISDAGLGRSVPGSARTAPETAALAPRT
jgi:non-specific serine/threonine protein kinase